MSNGRKPSQVNVGGINFQANSNGGTINQGTIYNNQGATIGNFAHQLHDQASQNYTIENSQALRETVQEVQVLLSQLSVNYPTATVVEKATLVEAALNRVEEMPSLKQRLLKSLEAGTLGAISQALNHPAAAFFIEAIKEWNASAQ